MEPAPPQVPSPIGRPKLPSPIGPPRCKVVKLPSSQPSSTFTCRITNPDPVEHEVKVLRDGMQVTTVRCAPGKDTDVELQGSGMFEFLVGDCTIGYEMHLVPSPPPSPPSPQWYSTLMFHPGNGRNAFELMQSAKPLGRVVVLLGIVPRYCFSFVVLCLLLRDNINTLCLACTRLNFPSIA
eukprot:m.195800 g.195800  ORF g.195800 m.195800 type:complete len:181 (-) comp14899_c1_seq5:1520-2062(-)